MNSGRKSWAAGAAGPPVEARVEQALAALERPSLRRVVNATGVVLHTNLGRAPLGPIHVLPGYSNLEYDLAAGRRGQRDVHAAGLLERLLGAPGIAVNNNAAAIFLALNELAAGGEVVVSRGELIEIGDGFRIPDIMARSGAAVREVGTTNRTGIADYRAAINERTRLLLRVHPSNFRISGFTARPELRELVALGRERGVPVYEDLGSGCVVDLLAFGIQEPLVSDSLKAGADLVSFSGDKLLGGPQAGILAGKPEIVARLRRNPLFRALRLDKIIYQALGEHAAQPVAGTVGRRAGAGPDPADGRRDSRARRGAAGARPGHARGNRARKLRRRRRGHAGAVHSHLADRHRVRGPGGRRAPPARGRSAGGGAHRKRKAHPGFEDRVSGRRGRTGGGAAEAVSRPDLGYARSW